MLAESRRRARLEARLNVRLSAVQRCHEHRRVRGVPRVWSVARQGAGPRPEDEITDISPMSVTGQLVSLPRRRRVAGVAGVRGHSECADVGRLVMLPTGERGGWPTPSGAARPWVAPTPETPAWPLWQAGGVRRAVPLPVAAVTETGSPNRGGVDLLIFGITIV